MLFPYLNTASGLSKWFADDVNVDQDKNLVFIWDEQLHRAKIAHQRVNHYVRFEFLDDTADDLEFIELRLEQSELTEAVFLIISDSSGGPNDEELFEIWQNQVQTLKETVGG
ncbi:MAG: ATPase [Cytophagales bacterium]|nr:ATPase [Cytophagales bacterium]